MLLAVPSWGTRPRLSSKATPPTAALDDDIPRTTTTDGTFRVLESTRGPEEWLLLDVEDAAPSYVTTQAHTEQAAPTVRELSAGNKVQATLAWSDGEPRFERLEILESTTVEFARTYEPLFGDAHGAYREACDADAAVASRVLMGQQGAPVGVVYAFVKQAGQRDLFEEFRDGVTPLEPLIGRLAEDRHPPFGVFVVNHHEEPFIAVILAFDQTGLLAQTVRESYFGASVFESGGLDLEPADPEDG
jgi:hypothetical protein